MKKLIVILLTTIYLFIIIISTTCVLTINKYNISQIGKYSFVNENSSLLIINKNRIINENDEIYYYDTYSKDITVKKQTVTKIEKINEIETLYTLEDKHLLSSKHLLGSSNCIKIPIAGSLLSFLTSTLGYLICIVLPILFILIYFTYNLRQELRKRK